MSTRDTRQIAVVCAMESEAVHLRARLEHPEEIGLTRWRRTRGTIGAHTVDVIVSGIGLINAGAATTALCTLENPAALLNYGCSGAHREDIAPGDVIIADRVVHFSSLVVLPDGSRRYQGFSFYVDHERVLSESIPADPELLAAAQDAGQRLNLAPWPGVEHRPVVYTGVVGSADIWTQHIDSIRDLHSIHGSLCEEMEAAAIAQVAAMHGVPFLAVKDISNNELVAFSDLSTPTGTILGHVQDEVGKRAAVLVEALISGMT